MVICSIIIFVGGEFRQSLKCCDSITAYNVLGDGTRQTEKKQNGRHNNEGRNNMKTYTFWVTLQGKSPMKVAEDGRTASEAKSIVESRFPGARVMFAEGF